MVLSKELRQRVAARRVALDPDRQIQDAVPPVFESSCETGSACAVVRRMCGENIVFPRCIRRTIGKGDMLWSGVDQVVQSLHDPRNAGAFVCGCNRSAFKA